jgi:tripartite-type tricarboxylate transporter receptor subunit TctC
MGQMARTLPDAGSYAPVTILIQELPGGGTRIAYDSVVSARPPAEGQTTGLAVAGTSTPSVSPSGGSRLRS